MRARFHHSAPRSTQHAALDAPMIPLLDSSSLPAEEDWSVVRQARAYRDAHAYPDDAQDFDFAIEPGGLD